MLTYSQRATFARQGAATINQVVASAVAEVGAQQEADRAARIAVYEAKVAPVPFSPAELVTARFVRTSAGWHKVVRVNAKSVTVETGYSWTDRHPIEKVLEVRA